MKIQTGMRVRARTINAATGRADRKWSKWKYNLVLDQGLNSLAQNPAGFGTSNPSSFFSDCQVGDGTNPNSYPSGSTQFTQALTTVACVAGVFFTPAMVGGILKYGTGSGGTEQYITGVTGTPVGGVYPSCTVTSSATVAATVGTVWMVQQTKLQNALYETSTYQTTGSSCGTTYSGAVITLQRTFNFASGLTYNANEIGYLNTNNLSACWGRIVLPSTVVVSPSQFLQVQLQLILSALPSTPVAVGNVGTGLNTAGTAALELLAFSTVNSSGNTVSPTSAGWNAGNLDGSDGIDNCLRIGSSPTQNSVPSHTGGIDWSGNIIQGGANVGWTYVPSSVGLMTADFSALVFSTSGQTLYGLGVTNKSALSNTVCADLVLTTPVVLPVGSFQPQFVFQMQFSRTLTN